MAGLEEAGIFAKFIYEILIQGFPCGMSWVGMNDFSLLLVLESERTVQLAFNSLFIVPSLKTAILSCSSTPLFKEEITLNGEKNDTALSAGA